MIDIEVVFKILFLIVDFLVCMIFIGYFMGGIVVVEIVIGFVFE